MTICFANRCYVIVIWYFILFLRYSLNYFLLNLMRFFTVYNVCGQAARDLIERCLKTGGKISRDSCIENDADYMRDLFG